MAAINLDFAYDNDAYSSAHYNPLSTAVLSEHNNIAESENVLTSDNFLVPLSIKNNVFHAKNNGYSHEHPTESGIKYNHGTTTLAFLFNGGVLVAVDSRASMGQYIGSGTVKKVIEISPYLLGTMAGGAADCSFWERNLAFQCRVHELREGKRISVAAASKLLGNTVYQYKDYGLSMGTMIAGWDETLGPQLYYMDNDGTRMKGDRFSVGSGATYAYGIMDLGWRADLTIPEAVELGKRSIYHATHRDAYSGGTINVFCITEGGWKQYYKGDMNELHYGQYAEEKAKLATEKSQRTKAQ
jgi:20S proteasome subunit beta 5